MLDQKPGFLGLEWKDFLSFSVSAFALVLSIFSLGWQYVDSYLVKQRQDRQVLYVIHRIGTNLGSAYSEYFDQTRVSADAKIQDNYSSLISSELGSIKISFRAEDVKLKPAVSYDGYLYGGANDSLAFTQIGDLIDTYYGKLAKSVFVFSYYAELSKIAITIPIVTKAEKSNQENCGVWIVYGSKALDALNSSIALTKTADSDCIEKPPTEFRKDLDHATSSLED